MKYSLNQSTRIFIQTEQAPEPKVAQVMHLFICWIYLITTFKIKGYIHDALFLKGKMSIKI